MTTAKKVFGWAIGILLIVIIAIVIFVATFDWNRLKPMINDKVSAELQRPFAIRGDFGVDWQRQPDQRGWRSWLPWPHIHAEDLVLGNPENIPGENMVTLERIDASIAPLPLLYKELNIPRIRLKQPNASLQRLANGDNNWTFHLANSDPQSDEKRSDWSVEINDIVFDQGEVAFKDEASKSDFHIIIDPLGKPLPFEEIVGSSTEKKQNKPNDDIPDYIFGWKITGRYNGEELIGSGKIGGMLSLENSDIPFPLQAEIRVGSTHIAVSGTLTAPMEMGGMDLQLKLSGISLDRLYPLTGVLLPQTRPYSTSGLLSARFNGPEGTIFSYQDFYGRIGSSDIHGTLSYTTSKPRPILKGELVSNWLYFTDLEPLIGADPNWEKAKRGDPVRQPANKVLPVEQFETESWRTMDADVKFTAQRIEHSDKLPLSNLYTHLVLKDAIILMDPLRFGVAGGSLNTTLRLDGSREMIQSRIDMHARGLQLKELFPDVETMRSSLGQIKGDATLSARGNSVSAMLGSSSGDVRLLVNDGVISRSLMDLAGLNIGSYLIDKLFGDSEVKINCGAADLNFRQGIATPRLFAIDTESTIIHITGDIDFATERFNLLIHPESKGIRILTLRSPLYIRGTFNRPDVGVEIEPLLIRGAAAIALGVVLTPAAALLAMVSINEGESKDDNSQCSKMLNQLRK